MYSDQGTTRKSADIAIYRHDAPHQQEDIAVLIEMKPDAKDGVGQLISYMPVRMAIELYDPTELTRLKVLDCCCGTGGFLVSWLSNFYDTLLDQESRRPSGKASSVERARHP